jgi:hypothetical protein
MILPVKTLRRRIKAATVVQILFGICATGFVSAGATSLLRAIWIPDALTTSLLI